MAVPRAPDHAAPPGEPAKSGNRAKDAHDLSGTTIDRYRVEERIGAGGMGEVYRAYDTVLRRAVALKRVRPGEAGAPGSPSPSDDEKRRHLLREARSASALSHPSIAAIYDVVDFRGEALIVQELVAGVPMTERLRAGRPFDLEAFFTIAEDCAGALTAAAACGIVHCDLKPANILLTADGRPRILDFGIARSFAAAAGVAAAAGAAAAAAAGAGAAGAVADSETTTTTAPAAAATPRIAGTPGYMAPEVIDGEAPTPATDVFSLGVIFYEMLAGAHPFRQRTAAATMASVIHDTPPPPSTMNPAVPPALDAAVARMLAKDPGGRYTSAEDLAADLRRARGEARRGAGARRRRSRRLAPLAIAAALAVAGAGWWIVTRPAREPGLPAGRHLVVQPFESQAADPAVGFFAAGMTEAVQARLAGLQGLDVLGAASELPAGLTLEGSVQRANDRLRIRYRIVDRARDRTIGGDVVEGEVRDLFALEDRVTEGIARVMARTYGLEATAGAAPRPTGDVGAYDLYLQGRGYLRRFEDEKNVEYAIELFEKALARDPHFPLAIAGMGEAYWKRYEATGDTAWARRAEATSLAALEADPGLAEVHVTLGTVYHGTGRAESAGREFRRAIELDPKSDAAYLGLARAEEAAGNLAAAEETYLRSIRARPDYWAGHNQLGVFYFRHGRYEEALAAFQHVVELTPDNARGYSNLGAVYTSLGRDSLAIAACEQSVRVKPNYRALNNLATLYRREGRLADAAGTYEKALAIDASDHRVWGGLGGTYGLIPGREARADSALERAAALGRAQLAVNPNDALLAAMLAQYEVALEHRAEALRLIERALLLAPEQAEVLWYAVGVFELAGKRERALAAVRAAVRAGYPADGFRKEPDYAGLVADPRFEKIVVEAAASRRGG